MSLTQTIARRIPVYVVNALYLWPITLWTYLNYGRPAKPQRKPSDSAHAAHHDLHAKQDQGEAGHAHCSSNGTADVARGESTATTGEHQHHSHHGGSERPMFATVTVAVCHCGAGCVIGDIIGEWIVYGAGVTINGRSLWPEYLIGNLLSS